jgi:geranylgeranyl diphosphate synthase, type II
VDEELERILPSAEEYPASIHRAMRHSVFAGGKRLRPILCMESGRLFGGREEAGLRLGCGLELIHTYSLIHDDLPALDNDDLRRGKPTCHRVFGEATAILAGDALLTLAFETISAPGPASEAQRLRVIYELAHAIGTRNGMVGGQVVDLETTRSTASPETLQYIHSAKTGAFIRMSVRAGAIFAGAREEDLDRITSYGDKIGLAFQIADDLLDVLGSSESLGKTAGKDGKQQKATYPALHGVEESQRIGGRLVGEACDVLEQYGNRSVRLQEIARYLITRKS